MKMYSFEKLDVWQKTRELTKDIFILTKKFPDEERFGLTSQLRRAIISVSCNIAEGTSRWSNKERVRFMEIAFSSLMEVLNCLIISFDLQLIDENALIDLRKKIDKISNKLNALSKSFKRMDN